MIINDHFWMSSYPSPTQLFPLQGTVRHQNISDIKRKFSFQPLMLATCYSFERNCNSSFCLPTPPPAATLLRCRLWQAEKSP